MNVPLMVAFERFALWDQQGQPTEHGASEPRSKRCSSGETQSWFWPIGITQVTRKAATCFDSKSVFTTFPLCTNQHTDAPTYFFFFPPFSFLGFSTTGGPMSRVFRYQLRISLSISA